MKIALCLRGQPRNYLAGHHFITKEIFSRYNDIDVFGHCWWDQDVVGLNYDTTCHVAEEYKIEKALDKTLNNLYNFAKVKFEHPKRWAPERQYRVRLNHNEMYNTLHSYFYSQKQVFLLLEQYEKENNIDYDWVIATRWDIGIYAPFPDLSQFNMDNIYVSDFHKGRKWILNDNLWVLGRKHKYVLKSLYDDFDKDYDMTFDMPEKYKDIIKGTEIGHIQWLNGEEHLAAHLLFNDALTSVITTDLLNYNMVR
jgi:hypothetical protein